MKLVFLCDLAPNIKLLGALLLIDLDVNITTHGVIIFYFTF